MLDLFYNAWNKVGIIMVLKFPLFFLDQNLRIQYAPSHSSNDIIRFLQLFKKCLLLISVRTYLHLG